MTHDQETKQLAEQAESIVRALDAYLATFPWPQPTVQSTLGGISTGRLDQHAIRAHLVETIATVLFHRQPRMDDPRRVML